MITADRAYGALRDANPAPVQEVDGLPSPTEALRRAQQVPLPPSRPRPPQRRIGVGLVTAAAVFLLVLALGALALFTTGDGDDVVDEPEVTTTLPNPTTTVPPTTAPPAAPPSITPETQVLLDEFAAAYGGDFDTFAALLDPELRIEILIELDPAVVWGLSELREQFEFYEALDTSLELGNCIALDSGAVSCLLLRTDDLTRIQGLEPATDVRITLRFEDGRVTSWTERPAKGDLYQLLAVAPFSRWLTENHPELPNPKVQGGAPWWTPRDGIVDLLPGLVAEYAESVDATVDD